MIGTRFATKKVEKKEEKVDLLALKNLDSPVKKEEKEEKEEKMKGDFKIICSGFSYSVPMENLLSLMKDKSDNIMMFKRSLLEEEIENLERAYNKNKDEHIKTQLKEARDALRDGNWATENYDKSGKRMSRFAVSCFIDYVKRHGPSNPPLVKEGYSSKSEIEAVFGKEDATFIENVYNVGMDQIALLESLAVDMGVPSLVQLVKFRKNMFVENAFTERKSDDPNTFILISRYIDTSKLGLGALCDVPESLRNIEKMREYHKLYNSGSRGHLERLYNILRETIIWRFADFGTLNVPKIDSKTFDKDMNDIKVKLSEGGDLYEAEMAKVKTRTEDLMNEVKKQMEKDEKTREENIKKLKAKK